MPERNVINGIDVKQLSEAVKAFKEQPDLAKYRFRAYHRWIHGAHSRTAIQDFYGSGEEDTSRLEPFILDADEPEALLGEDNGPNATEVLLHALAACLSTSFVVHASADGVKVEELELDLEGEIDLQGLLGLSDQVRNGFEQIHVAFHVKADASEEKIAELVELAQRRSPVYDVVTHPVPVTVSIETKLPAVT